MIFYNIYANEVQVNNEKPFNNNNIFVAPSKIERIKETLKCQWCRPGYLKNNVGKPINCDDVCIFLFCV